MAWFQGWKLPVTLMSELFLWRDAMSLNCPPLMAQIMPPPSSFGTLFLSSMSLNSVDLGCSWANAKCI